MTLADDPRRLVALAIVVSPRIMRTVGDIGLFARTLHFVQEEAHVARAELGKQDGAQGIAMKKTGMIIENLHWKSFENIE